MVCWRSSSVRRSARLAPWAVVSAADLPWYVRSRACGGYSFDRVDARKTVRETGWPASSAKGGRGELRFPTTIIFRPTSSPGDSNWGVVTFENGRVGEVDFSPD